MRTHNRLIAVLALGLYLLATPALARGSDYLDTYHDFAVGAANVAGTWSASGQFDSGGAFTDTWVIEQAGPLFILSSGFGFTAIGVAVNSSIAFLIGEGCFPVYYGKVSGDLMQGSMVCTNGTNGGTWQANRVSSGLRQPKDNPSEFDRIGPAGP